jgi:hypothetical protein
LQVRGKSRTYAPIALEAVQGLLPIRPDVGADRPALSAHHGVRSLDVQCHNCRHRVIVNVDHLPGDLTVPSFGPFWRMFSKSIGSMGS